MEEMKKMDEFFNCKRILCFARNSSDAFTIEQTVFSAFERHYRSYDLFTVLYEPVFDLSDLGFIIKSGFNYDAFVGNFSIDILKGLSNPHHNKKPIIVPKSKYSYTYIYPCFISKFRTHQYQEDMIFKQCHDPYRYRQTYELDCVDKVDEKTQTVSDLSSNSDLKILWIDSKPLESNLMNDLLLLNKTAIVEHCSISSLGYEFINDYDILAGNFKLSMISNLLQDTKIKKPIIIRPRMIPIKTGNRIFNPYTYKLEDEYRLEYTGWEQIHEIQVISHTIYSHRNGAEYY